MSTVFKIGGTWGDAIQWLKVDELTVVGWKRTRPAVGDLLHAAMESGRIGVFRFSEVTYQRDPDDMFFATVELKGYADD